MHIPVPPSLGAHPPGTQSSGDSTHRRMLPGAMQAGGVRTEEEPRQLQYSRDDLNTNGGDRTSPSQPVRVGKRPGRCSLIGGDSGQGTGGRAEGRAWANPSGGGAFQELRVLARGRHGEEEACRGAPEKARVRRRP